MQKKTLLDYLRSLKPYAPVPHELMTIGELVEILEELHELRARQCACFEKKEVTETERIRRLAIAIHALQTILRLLENAGAQTRP